MTLTTADGLLLQRYRWLPPDAARGAVVLVHGIAEHAGRYGHVAAYLNGAGYAVEAFDLRGHGRSEGPRAYVTDFAAYLDDLDRVLAQVRAAHPGVPLFLLGHSMGGMIATHHVLERQPRLDGLVLSAPALAAGTDFSALRSAAARLLGRFLPRLPVQKLEAAHLSHDPAVEAAYESDPLVWRGWLRAGMGAAMLRTLAAIERREPELALPLLVLQGTADEIVNPGGADRLVRRAASADKTFVRYEDFYHEIFNEVGKERVLADVRAWLDAHTPAP